MDRGQAKEILLGYRPGRDNAADPQTAEALALLERDPELRLWFEQQQRVDDAIRIQLREMPVPTGLRERILAEQKVVRPEFSWRRTILAAAAGVALLAGLFEWINSRPVSIDTKFSAYRKQMVQIVSDSYSLNIKGNSFEELRQGLAQRQWPTDFAVPDRLHAVTVVGGGALNWNGHKVVMACMKQDDHGLWLFVIEKSALRRAPDTETPRVETVGTMPTAAWSQGDKTYLFAANGDEAFLRKYLP